MLMVFIIVVLCFCAAQGDVLEALKDSSVNCREANEETDRILAKSNLQIKKEGEDIMWTDWYGFERDVSLYAFGWKLPISVSLKVSNGTLIGMNTLKRSEDVSECSTSTARTLKGYFDYGPELTLSYDVANAQLFNRRVRGKFIFKPKLRMYVVLHNETGGNCRLETVRMARPEASPGQSEYIFLADNNCWVGWFISKLLVWGLQLKDETPMMTQVVLWSQGEIFKYLTDAWCQSK